MTTTVPDLLVRGLDLPALPKPPVETPAGTRCAMTGVEIAAGYPILSLVSNATAEYLDTFRGNPGCIHIDPFEGTESGILTGSVVAAPSPPTTSSRPSSCASHMTSHSASTRRLAP